MFLRFTISRVNEDSHRSQGLLVAAYELLDSGNLSPDEWKRVRELLDWFNQHLPHPPKEFSNKRAIFWFRSRNPQTHECIDRMWELVHLAREHGYHVELHKCRTLANICYRDELQVAAYPSSHDSRIVIT